MMYHMFLPNSLELASMVEYHGKALAIGGCEANGV
jgi:hypothetical protein